MIRKLLLAAIRGYKRFLSPILGQHCRFTPTCSEYTARAIETHGVLKGIMLGTCRIVRCNPFSRAGHDPVPPKFEVKIPWITKKT
jgi:putative membrane protein insertion efficiency factor